MLKQNILIVEDESIVAKDIQQTLIRLGYNVVGIASTGEKAIQLAQAEYPELILMDIMLKGEMTGIDVAQIIKEKLGIPIIYITAYADETTISKSKYTEPYGYIIKPFKEIDVQTAIEIALYKHSQQQELSRERDFLFSIVEHGNSQSEFIFIKSGGKQNKVNTRDILFIEALKDYVIIYTKETKFTIHSTMKEIESNLGFKNFVRVHRSYIVRLDKIETIEFSNLTLESTQKFIPIGGSYREELAKRIKTI
jgi:DNA-binding LytR/AlgR family response regulator